MKREPPEKTATPGNAGIKAIAAVNCGNDDTGEKDP